LNIIGHITKPEEGSVLITNGNNRIELSAQGWNHLKKV
jgi:hypothetical protein